MSAVPHIVESLGDFEASPELDARLGAMALRARTDIQIRNDLYRALNFKIERFVRRYRYRVRQLAVCEVTDVEQEAFLVFCDIVDRWPGQESFLGYFFSRFPWRLARAVDVLERGWSATRMVPLDEIAEPAPPPDPTDVLLLAEIGASLEPRERTVLELRIGYNLRVREIARILGLHSRTIQRSWARIVEELRIGYGVTIQQPDDTGAP
ncbi:MAG: sigma-70 family RNA polymerase sigma factor [Nitrolancea sp.]